MSDAKSALKASGATVSVACNLPHGLRIDHAGRNVLLNGANHPRAISTDTTRSGIWGITHNVDEEWLDDWVKTAMHPAAVNGHIIKNTPAKIEDHAVATADAVKTGTDPLNPDAPTPGVEQRDDED
jgi:hypothetical protein